jgi:hypothetical protein
MAQSRQQAACCSGRTAQQHSRLQPGLPLVTRKPHKGISRRQARIHALLKPVSAFYVGIDRWHVPTLMEKHRQQQKKLLGAITKWGLRLACLHIRQVGAHITVLRHCTLCFA